MPLDFTKVPNSIYSQPRRFDNRRFAWIRFLIAVLDSHILHYSGLDAMLFHRFLWDMLRLFIFLAVLILPILIPLNLVHGRSSSDNVHGLDRLSWANIGATHDNYYWAHWVLLMCTVLSTCAMVYREMIFYIKVRQSHLRLQVQQCQLASRTILVTGIPQDLLLTDKLTSLYGLSYGGVQHVWINRNYSKLTKKIAKRDATRAALEVAELKIIQKCYRARVIDGQKNYRGHTDAPLWSHYLRPKDRQTMRIASSSWLPAIPWLGKKVDLIDHHREELIRLNESIRKMQTHVNEFPMINSAFIMFKDAMSANIASQSLLDPRLARLVVECIDVAPHDIVWKNLGIGWWEKSLRAILIWLCVVFLISA